MPSLAADKGAYAISSKCLVFLREARMADTDTFEQARASLGALLSMRICPASQGNPAAASRVAVRLPCFATFHAARGKHGIDARSRYQLKAARAVAAGADNSRALHPVVLESASARSRIAAHLAEKNFIPYCFGFPCFLGGQAQ